MENKWSKTNDNFDSVYDLFYLSVFSFMRIHFHTWVRLNFYRFLQSKRRLGESWTMFQYHTFVEWILFFGKIENLYLDFRNTYSWIEKLFIKFSMLHILRIDQTDFWEFQWNLESWLTNNSQIPQFIGILQVQRSNFKIFLNQISVAHLRSSPNFLILLTRQFAKPVTLADTAAAPKSFWKNLKFMFLN